MDVEKWVIIPLLYALPVGVFYLGFISPEHRPAAIQFASVAFGALLALLGSKLAATVQARRVAYKSQDSDKITKIQ
jgi:hypothetical protein